MCGFITQISDAELMTVKPLIFIKVMEPYSGLIHALTAEGDVVLDVLDIDHKTRRVLFSWSMPNTSKTTSPSAVRAWIPPQSHRAP